MKVIVIESNVENKIGNFRNTINPQIRQSVSMIDKNGTLFTLEIKSINGFYLPTDKDIDIQAEIKFTFTEKPKPVEILIK